MSQRSIGLVIDSTFLPDSEWVKNNNVSIVKLKIYIGDKEYQEGEISSTEVVNSIEAGIKVTTSQPTPIDFATAYQYQLDQGYDDVICLTLSKTLSGTLNGANLVANDFKGRVHVIDTESAVCGSLHVAERLLEELDKGINIKEAQDFTQELKQAGSVIFTVENLRTLVAGGRLSKLKALVGNVFKIKPILRFKNGHLELERTARGFNKVVDFIVSEVQEMMKEFKTLIRIVYVGRNDSAVLLEKRMLEIPGADVKILGEISPIIAAHIGLGGMGIFVTKKI